MTDILKSPLGLIFVAFLALLLWIVVMPAANEIALQITPSEHSVEKHGAAAVDAASCIDNPNSKRFWNPKTERFGFTCQIGDKWAVAFTTKSGRHITSFFKEKLRTFEQVMRYMANTGYAP